MKVVQLMAVALTVLLGLACVCGSVQADEDAGTHMINDGKGQQIKCTARVKAKCGQVWNRVALTYKSNNKTIFVYCMAKHISEEWFGLFYSTDGDYRCYRSKIDNREWFSENKEAQIELAPGTENAGLKMCNDARQAIGFNAYE